MGLLLLVLSFALLLGGAILFTNAVEWFGRELRLAQGAVGSLLAAVGTALPESLIPVVAVLGGGDGSEVAVGAIIGAPFLLATLALALVAASTLAFRRRRASGAAIAVELTGFRRDLSYFAVLFVLAVALGLGAPRWLQIAGAVFLVGAYGEYVARTLRRSSARGVDEHPLSPLYIDASRRDPPTRTQIVIQLAMGLAAIVGGAHLFVEEVVRLAESAGVSALVLSLVLAPLATELPEKANSFLWIRQGKDTLALGNITGAMVFQSSLPVAIGLCFTDWELTAPSLVAAVLALAGAVLAYFVVARRRRARAISILAWAGLYAAFVAFVVAS